MEDVLEGTAYAGATAQFAQDDGVNPIRVLDYGCHSNNCFLWKKDYSLKKIIFL